MKLKIRTGCIAPADACRILHAPGSLRSTPDAPAHLPYIHASQHAESKMNVVLDHPVAQTGSPSRSPSFCEAAGQCEEKHRSSPKLRLTGTSTNDDQ